MGMGLRMALYAEPLRIMVVNATVCLPGTRLHEEDVAALLASQAALQRLVPGFRFNLGFSAKYYHHGTALENRGDDALLRNREYFTW